MKKLLFLILFLLSLISSSVFSDGYMFSDHSRDGSDVACGGKYMFSDHSRDGSSVCVGGKYMFSAHSRDGSDVAAQWDGD